jgi:hypothetical protein
MEAAPYVRLLSLSAAITSRSVWRCSCRALADAWPHGISGERRRPQCALACMSSVFTPLVDSKRHPLGAAGDAPTPETSRSWSSGLPPSHERILPGAGRSACGEAYRGRRRRPRPGPSVTVGPCGCTSGASPTRRWPRNLASPTRAWPHHGRPGAGTSPGHRARKVNASSSSIASSFPGVRSGSTGTPPLGSIPNVVIRGRQRTRGGARVH